MANEADSSTDLETRRALYGGTIALEMPDILEILPHRGPVLLVDRVYSLVPGQHAVGCKVVTGNEYGLSRPRRGFVFPSTLAFEAIGQLAALALLFGQARAADDEPNLALAAVQELTVHREMLESGVIHLSVDVQRRRRGIARIEGHATLEGQPYLDALFDLAVG
ncbi:MAG: hypothetical protein AAF581_03200 [Planctomycetota bacterium]